MSQGALTAAYLLKAGSKDPISLSIIIGNAQPAAITTLLLDADKVLKNSDGKGNYAGSFSLQRLGGNEELDNKMLVVSTLIEHMNTVAGQAVTIIIDGGMQKATYQLQAEQVAAGLYRFSANIFFTTDNP
ncbi:MAG: hypothetical protein BGO69_01715 [Bacteroidetes bacterium 46-16]|jgi:hypothetical protein|nr:MAG: hypothetical protein BGO69_01715 [Bacteroidetes bacterium 46-16]